MTIHRNADSIFLAAVEMEQENERAAFLDGACGNDNECRAKVEELLAAHHKAGSFMRQEDGPLATVDHALQLGEGTEIGNYKLLQRIGEGGFGAVYMAEQQRPVRRKVALKVVKPGMDSKDVIARFEAERQALALMDHPNIAKVLDAGTTESGRPYFVMELVKGVPVTKYCDKNRLSTKERLELFVPLCHAVQHAHQKGVIHRDIKPSNIMVTLHDGKPVPKVIDFGVSKALNQQLTEKTLFTRYGQMIGTPQYMSPEQAEMSGLDVDTRSDIFSLGVVLYELLTGQTPLDPNRMRSAGFVEMQRMIQDEEPPRPSVRLSTLGEKLTIVAKHRSVDPGKLRQTIQGELDWIVMKALEKDRGRRYDTASSFADDVERYLGDEPIEACPPSTVYRLRKFARRNKGPVTAVVAVSTALVLGIIVATVGMIDANASRGEAVAVAKDLDTALHEQKTLADEAQEARANADATSRRHEEDLYAQRVARAYQHVRANQPIDALQQLEACPEHFRDFEWHLVKRLCHGQGLRSVDVPGRVHNISVRSSDEKVAVGLHNGRAVFFNRHMEERREILFHSTPPEHLLMRWVQLSPSQDLLAAVSDSENVKLIHEPTGELMHILSDKRPVASVAFSPNGQTLATVGEDNTVRLWDTATGTERFRLPIHESHMWSWAVCFSPNGNLLAAASVEGEVSVWDVGTRTLQYPPRREHWAPVTSLRFSPDSKTVVSGSFDLFIKLRDSGSGELVLEPWKAGKRDVNCVAYNPAGTRIASASSDGTITIWNAETGKELLVLIGHDEDPKALAFSGDGQRLYSGGIAMKIHVWDGSKWDESLERKPKILEKFNSRVLALDIKSDGSELAAGGEDGVVITWNLPTAQTKREFPIHGATIGAVVFDLAYEPDGSHIISSGGSEKHFNAAIHWDPESGHKKNDEIPFQREVFAVAVHPSNDRFVLSGFNGKLTVYDCEDGQQTNILGRQDRPTGKMMFSPDGRYLVSCTDEREINLWDAKRLDEPQECETLLDCRGFWYLQMGFHPDGRLLVVGDGNEVLLYDLESRTEVDRLAGHGDTVNATAFSHDGRFIASGSTDGTVKLWDAKSGKLIETLLAEGAVYRVVFTPDGDWLATAGEDTNVKLWNLIFLSDYAVGTREPQ